MRATIIKTFTFEAAHRLEYHAGKCERQHGHSYRVDVELAGEVADRPGASDHGMVVDFNDVTRVWKDTVEPLLDHQDLNETLGIYTTAENIAGWILHAFVRAGLPEAFAVTVWETATGRARVTDEDIAAPSRRPRPPRDRPRRGAAQPGGDA